jgi:hypothetical protein
MNRTTLIHRGLCRLLAAALSLLFAVSAYAQVYYGDVIPGITGPAFSLATGPAYIDTPDGDSVLMWGCADTDGGTAVQYPCPTLIVNEGDTVTIDLTNNLLSQATSLVFPGQGLVSTTGGTAGLLTAEAASGGGTVSYSFTASEPGTYMYQSGTNTALQVEMGLLGVIIVRPAGFDQDTNRTAYGHPDTAYDQEHLFLLTQMAVAVHDLVDFGFEEYVDLTTYFATHWFINGRNGLDTLEPNNVPWAPHQPYGALARTLPGDKILLRLIGGSRKLHPMHPHGNHTTIIARDGRMATSDPDDPALGPDLRVADYTYDILPGGTYDTLFDWTGWKLGWDIYGDAAQGGIDHDCEDLVENRPGSSEAVFDPDNICYAGNTDGYTGDCMGDIGTGTPWEYCPDHYVEFPVDLPNLQDMTPGGLWSGNAFLGSFGALPPGEGGLNLFGGISFIWHSHDEKELLNNDIFPGGMLTFVFVEPPGTPMLVVLAP